MQVKLSFTQKYDPMHTLLSFQHQANHYKNIVNPRKTYSYFDSIQNQKKKKTNHLSLFESKFEKQKRQSIRKQNKRIFKDCVQIEKKKGILQRAQQQFKSIQNQKGRKLSLKNPYKQKLQEQKRIKYNLYQKQKLNNLKPLIGDKKQWKKHEQFSNKIVQKLRAHSSQVKQRYKAQNILKLIINNQKGTTGGFLRFFKLLQTSRQESKDHSQQRSKHKTQRSKKRRSIRKRLQKNDQENMETQEINKKIEEKQIENKCRINQNKLIQENPQQQQHKNQKKQTINN